MAQKICETMIDALNSAINGEWENGMATNNYTVVFDAFNVSFTKKCGSPDNPEILLIKVKTIQGITPEMSEEFKEVLIETTNFYGDLSLEFEKHSEREYSCIIGMDMLV